MIWCKVKGYIGLCQGIRFLGEISLCLKIFLINILRDEITNISTKTNINITNITIMINMINIINMLKNMFVMTRITAISAIPAIITHHSIQKSNNIEQMICNTSNF